MAGELMRMQEDRETVFAGTLEDMVGNLAVDEGGPPDCEGGGVNHGGGPDWFVAANSVRARGRMDEARAMEKWKRVVVVEVKKVCYIAIPMVVVNVSQYLMRLASLSIVGHLGELQLAGTILANSLASVTGFSLLFAMASGLETLCGQAYGAEEYKKLGTYTYSAIISLLLLCLPISVLWIFMEKLLILIGQDPLISAEAHKYAIWLIPSLFPYTFLQSLNRYLLSQSLVLPMLVSSVAVLIFHVPICWALVFHSEMGNAGAALAIALSYTLNAILLGLYVTYSSSCEQTRISFSNDVFPTIREFLRYAIPASGQTCLEWWFLEGVVLVAGLLPNPKLETSVLAISTTIATLHYYIPCSFGAAASTRVSNELGAGNPKTARMVVWIVMVIGMVEAIIASSILLPLRSVVGYAFGNAKEVVHYLREMTPLICLFVIVDACAGLLCGVARGSGWQRIGAYINLGAYYLVGVPVALLLCFVVHMRAKGLWIGLVVGSAMQSILLAIVTCSTNWQKQATKARERIFDGRTCEDEVIKA